MTESTELSDALLLLWQQKQRDLESLAHATAKSLCELSEEHIAGHTTSQIWPDDPQNNDLLTASFIQQHQNSSLLDNVGEAANRCTDLLLSKLVDAHQSLLNLMSIIYILNDEDEFNSSYGWKEQAEILKKDSDSNKEFHIECRAAITFILTESLQGSQSPSTLRLNSALHLFTTQRYLSLMKPIEQYILSIKNSHPT